MKYTVASVEHSCHETKLEPDSTGNKINMRDRKTSKMTQGASNQKKYKV
jgi:hypothetical protein